MLRGESKPEDALISLEGVDLRLGERIESLDAVEADTIVLATGATPRQLGDALAFRTLDDSLDLRRRAESAKTATVIGGGFIGCEITASLTMIGVKVTQIVRDPMLFATIELPAALGGRCTSIYRANGVDLRLDASDIPDADIVVAGIGVEPNVELARDAGLEVRSGVVVDERFRTSRDGVYAVGDVAEFFDPLYGRHRRIEHWSTAAYHGTTLGQILAGDADARYDTVSSFFSEEFGRSFRSFGDASGHDDTSLEGDFAGDHAALPVPEGRGDDLRRRDRARRRGAGRAQGRDQSRRSGHA